jgi:hypothetical protein
MDVMHDPVQSNTPLLPERAGLSVTADQARLYAVLDRLIREHGASSNYIYAGPDSPELYFLSRKSSPLRTMYEFFDTSGDLPEKILRAVQEKGVGVVVINQRPEFSPPLDPTLQAALRHLFPYSAQVGQFRVSWKK